MTRKFMLLSAFAGLVLVPSSPAEDLTNPASPAKGVTLMSDVTCKGYASVPMTADAEQALPLHVVANLECGQEVAVLSNLEGYTVRIQTEDGKNGYVACLFLSKPTLRRTSGPAAVEDAQLVDGAARWQHGSAGSSEFTSGDMLVESLTVNGITVQVSLQDTGWKLRANVAVANSSSQTVYVMPRLLSLEEIAPSVKPLAYQDPAHIGKATNHQILWTASTAGPTGGAQPDRSSSSSAGVMSASYKLPSTPSPNYLAQHQALEEIAAKNQTALVDMAREINALALRECTLKQNEKTAGAVWFERDSKSRLLILRVPVGSVIYEFPLSFNHDK
jgi:hypothetical protein